MKVYIKGKIYDTEETAIVLIFKNDQERRGVGSQICDMPKRIGTRMYANYPDKKYTEQTILKLFDTIKTKLKS